MFCRSSDISRSWSLTITARPMASAYPTEIVGLSLTLQHLLSSKAIISQQPIHVYTNSQSVFDSIPELMTSSWDCCYLTCLRELLY